MNTWKSATYKIEYNSALGHVVISLKGILAYRHVLTIEVYNIDEAKAIKASLLRNESYHGYGAQVVAMVWHDRIITTKL